MDKGLSRHTPRKRIFDFISLSSIRLRVILLVLILVLAATISLTFYTLNQFEKANKVELEHDGLLLANALEATIAPLAQVRDISGLQERIDSLSEARQNAIEVNIMLLQNEGSAIVASNSPGNIRVTSSREHAVLLTTLDQAEPVIFVGRHRNYEEDEATYSNFLGDDRFLSVTTPLMMDAQPLGSINVNLSLDELDDEIVEIRFAVIVATIIEIGVILTALILLLTAQIFRPLRHMAVKMRSISGGDLTQRIEHKGPENEIGELANTFDEMLDKLQAAFEREKRFTADVAHELRTPMAALKGRIEIALNQSRTQEEYRDTLQNLQNEVDRLARLSEDMLFLTRLGQRRLSPRFEKIDFSDLIGAIVDQMRPSAQLKGIIVDEDFVSDIILQGDSDYLIRLFLNIIDNAIKYTSPGSRITVKADVAADKVTVIISDTGPGIAQENLPFLFERFYRADSARSRGEGGAGLGLSIAYELARSHHGDIQVQSEPGQGTTFTVYLPINPQ